MDVSYRLVRYSNRLVRYSNNWCDIPIVVAFYTIYTSNRCFSQVKPELFVPFPAQTPKIPDDSTQQHSVTGQKKAAERSIATAQISSTEVRNIFRTILQRSSGRREPFPLMSCTVQQPNETVRTVRKAGSWLAFFAKSLLHARANTAAAVCPPAPWGRRAAWTQAPRAAAEMNNNPWRRRRGGPCIGVSRRLSRPWQPPLPGSHHPQQHHLLLLLQLVWTTPC